MSFLSSTLIILILFTLTTSQTESLSTPETCNDDNTKQQEYPLQYTDNFLSQPKYNSSNPLHNNSHYFDLSTNDQILKLLKQHKIIPYPKRRFISRSQGNFLHFLHLAYTKNLPIYFTVDQMLYPYIENTYFFNMDYIETIYSNLLKLLYNNILSHCNHLKYDKDILLYFSIGLSMLDENNINLYNKDKCKEIRNFLFAEIPITNDTNQNNTDNGLSLLMYNLRLGGINHTINRLTFIPITSFWKASLIIRNVFNSIKWFTNIKFNIQNELSFIYNIGKAISESGQSKLYLHIKSIYKYLFNEEQTSLNPLEIYNIIKQLNLQDKLNNDIETVYKTIQPQLKTIPNLSFMNNYTFSTNYSQIHFENERFNHTSLFYDQFKLETWINSKLISPPKGRLFPSFFEFADIALNGTLMRELIQKRYEGNATYAGKLYRYRDGVDMNLEFNSTHDIIINSYKNETSKWLNTYHNSFNYLLWTIGRIRNKDDNTNFQMKQFNTLMGAFIHFNHDIHLIEQYTDTKPSKETYTGKISDIYFEENIPFYENLINITRIYKQTLNNSINYAKTFLEFNATYVNDIAKALNIYTSSIIENSEYIIKEIQSQFGYLEYKTNSTLKDKMFYYDNNTHQYKGWYMNMFPGRNEDNLFKFDLYVTNYYSSRPISRIKFPGVVSYIAMNYIEMGMVMKEDIRSKENKVLMYAGYAGNEYPHGWSDEISFDGLKRLLVSRK